MDPERKQGIRDFVPPMDVKRIAKFVGMVNFYWRYIPNAAEIAVPLNGLRMKDELAGEWVSVGREAADGFQYT